MSYPATASADIPGVPHLRAPEVVAFAKRQAGVRASLVAVLVFLGLISACQGQPHEVAVDWLPVADPKVAGFRVFFGLQPGAYFAFRSFTAADALTHATVRLPLGGLTYFLAVSTVSELGLESERKAAPELVVVPADGTAVELHSLVLRTDEDTPVRIPWDATLIASNADLLIPAPPEHGRIQGNLECLEYQPAPDFFGTDMFRVIIAQEGESARQYTVHVDVVSTPDAPIAYDESYSTPAGTPVVVHLAGWDPDATTPGFEVRSPPEFGELTGTPPDLVYTPATGFSGSDEFEYVTTDGEFESATAWVRLFVDDPSPEPPVREEDLIVREDSAGPLRIWWPQGDTGTINYTVMRAPEHGELRGLPPVLAYVPKTNYFGPDLLQYAVLPSAGSPTEVIVHIQVSPVNDPPLVLPERVYVIEGIPSLLRLVGSDSDGDPFTLQVDSPPAHGALYGDAPVLQYEPDEGFSGTDALTFTARDQSLESESGTVEIVVIPGSQVIPRIETRVEGGVLLLQWNAVPGRTYRILRRQSIDGSWTRLGTSVLPDGDTLTFPVDMRQGWGFFAIELVPF